ncbi:MAG: alanine racemase [Gammaproteobacteria bacterium]
MLYVERIINAAALRANFAAVRKRTAAKNIIAVIKSDAYGHGLLTVADALADIADAFAVAKIADAKKLRANGMIKPVLLISGASCREQTADIVRLGLWTAVQNARQLEWLKDAPAHSGICAFVKADIGMNRLGFAPAQWAAAQKALTKNPAIGKTLLMAHFARADEPGGMDDALATLQPLRAAGCENSLGNSAASLLPHCRGDIGDDWARIGIALYGASPAPYQICRDALGLSAAMTLRAGVIAIRKVRRGRGVGYGGKWRAKKDTTIAIVSCGYGDGYPRLCGDGKTIWAQVVGGDGDGKKAPVVGRVSMEMTALDISECGQVGAGDKVVMWGDSPSVDEVASAAGRISYELLTQAGRGD